MNESLLEKYRYRTALILACQQFSENNERADALEETFLRSADEIIRKIPFGVIQAFEEQEKIRADRRR